MFKRLFFVSFLAFSLISAAHGHHDEQHDKTATALVIGPVIDAPAPEFTGVNTQGDTIALENVAGSQGTVIVFVRSADWCPFCKRQLIELKEITPALVAKGWKLVGVSYDTPEKLAAFAGGSDIPYPLISDTDSAMIKAFGLLNEEVNPASRSYGIPHPAVVFVNASGNVKAVLREEGYRSRPSLDDITQTALKLSGAS